MEIPYLERPSIYWDWAQKCDYDVPNAVSSVLMMVTLSHDGWIQECQINLIISSGKLGLYSSQASWENERILFTLLPLSRDSPTVWPLCAFFFILLQFYVPFYVKKKKNDNFVCLLEFECAKRLKAHSRAIPAFLSISVELIYFHYIDGLVQDSSNSSALAMELLRSCTKPSNS